MKNALILKPWFWHSLCCLAALICCVPVLWAESLPHEWKEDAMVYGGLGISVSCLLSLALIVVTSVHKLLRLRNLSAMAHALVWVAQWFCTWLLFVMLAFLANVPLPSDGHVDTKAGADLRAPKDHLTGPGALVIAIDLTHADTDKVADTPNISLLSSSQSPEQQPGTRTARLLDAYITASPRWSVYTEDDTFYTKPGHVVMLPNSEGKKPGIMHVAFRRVSHGSALPEGYVCVKPGDPLPTSPEGIAPVTDVAIDLEGDYYLLLAWRGVSQKDVIHHAINASITTVDSLLQPLADAVKQHKSSNELESALEDMLEGKRNLTAAHPELLICEPPTQYGAYQAEVYVNPGEPGRVILKLIDEETNTTLRSFDIQARFSDNPNELFRHDVPGDAGAAVYFDATPGLIPRNAQLFAVREGTPHEFFGVAAEVTFRPSSHLKPQRVLIPKRYYRMQACERLTRPEPEINHPANH